MCNIPAFLKFEDHRFGQPAEKPGMRIVCPSLYTLQVAHWKVPEGSPKMLLYPLDLVSCVAAVECMAYSSGLRRSARCRHELAPSPPLACFASKYMPRDVNTSSRVIHGMVYTRVPEFVAGDKLVFGALL